MQVWTLTVRFNEKASEGLKHYGDIWNNEKLSKRVFGKSEEEVRNKLWGVLIKESNKE